MSATSDNSPEERKEDGVEDDSAEEEPPAQVRQLPSVPAPEEPHMDFPETEGQPVGNGKLFYWLKDRCLGRGLCVDPARDNYRTMTSLYSSIQPADSVNLSTRTHGAVFNLEYSPDG